ncbi:L-methionine/branched-chain amino acid transporter [Thalassotalea marina]|uniref:L-methionine/branched-chain amino acid transporter n=1 Tax=Thalassotalea marina TaxID=1673741 RepID=A0A919BHR0_9GAMM|nr:L-methionine/branched-chain amino acid transporter [Thalassotalea marina]GHF89938.1 L-methionine/branched-chain amino acid transporter [Thalassotalea marina]
MNKLSRWQGAGLLATTLLGTSVFILPQSSLNIAGENAIWAWVLLTLAIIPVTIIFGQLSANFPHAAGPAHFVEQAFGRVIGRAIGLSFLFAVPLGVPAAILMTYQFIDGLVSLSSTQQWLVQLAMLTSIYIVNFRGIRVSAQIQLVLTLVIVMVVAAMLFAALFSLEHAGIPVPNQDDINPLLIAAGLAFWSFLGVEAMSHLSDDFAQPAKDLIPAMLIGILLVGMVYVVCTLILYWLPNDQPLSMAVVFDQLFGGLGHWIIGLLGIAGGLATVNVYTASAAKLLASFAQQQILPRVFAKQNKHNVANRALLFILTIMAIVITYTYIADKQLEDLIFWVNGVFILIYLSAMLAAYKLLANKYRWLIHCSVLFCLVIIYGLGWNMSYAFCILSILVPIVWYQQKHLTSKVQNALISNKI